MRTSPPFFRAGRRSTALRSAGLLLATCAAPLVSAEAWGQTAAERPAAADEASAGERWSVAEPLVRVESAHPRLSALEVRAAIVAELERQGLQPAQPLRVGLGQQGQARLSSADAQGLRTTRELTLPKNDADALETLGLLGASLVRSESEDLAAALGPNAAPAPQAAPGSEAATAPQAASTQPPASTADAAPNGATHPVDPSGKAPPQATAARPPSADSSTSPSDAPTSAPTLTPAPLNVSFAHPLALLPDSQDRRLHLELGLFYSHVGAVDGVALNPFVLRIEQASSGVITGGAWTELGGPLRGVSTTWGAQRGQGLRGASLTGLVDLQEGSVKGLQLSGVYASAQDLQGAGIAGVASRQHNTVGLQVGGVAALGASTEGLQLGGVATWSASVTGAQVAGVAGGARSVDGAQLAGVLSYAERVEGLQLATVNVSQHNRGAQIGVVNVAQTVRGTQIGVVNVAERVDGFPVGLVNAVGNGRNQAVLWYGGTRTPYNGALKYMHGPVYTLLAVSARPHDSDRVTLAPGAGLGVRLSAGERLFFELDGLWQHEMLFGPSGQEAGGDQLVRLRAAAGYEVTPWLALFAGGGPQMEIDRTTHDLSFDPHFMAGVQVF